MRKFNLMAGVILLAASCSGDCELNEKEVRESATVSVFVRDFSMSMEDFVPSGTRGSQSVAEYSGVKALTLAFYSGDTEVFKTTQLRDDGSTYTTFGEFSCSLPMGSYTMVVLGYGSESPITLTSPTSAAFTADKGRETFVATQSVNITSTGAVTLTAALERVVTKLKLLSTDIMPTDVAKVNISLAKGGLSFNPTTGFATVNTGHTNEITPTTGFGQATAFNTYFFLASDEQEINVTVNVLDAEEHSLFTKVVENVPFKRNRQTVLRGKLFSAGVGASGFTIETDWLDDHTVDF
jgi:hypothetical protein